MKIGILNRATEAKATNEQKTAEEELKLGVTALSIDYRKNTTNSQTFKQFVTSDNGANLKTAMGLAANNQDLIVENAENGIVSYKGQKYQVDDYGGVGEYVKPTYTWTQTGTSVTNGTTNLIVGQAVSGYSVTANVGGAEKTIGDGNWFVLGAEDGKLLITTNTNPENVQLSGKDGYTGGVALLNLTAEKYTNSNLADGNARSINVDDINRVTGYDPNVAQYCESATSVNRWDNDVTYTLDNSKIYYKGTKYPIYAANELGAQSSYSSCEYWKENAWLRIGGSNATNTTIKNTNYFYFPNTLTISESDSTVGISTDSLAYMLLFTNTKNSKPWLSDGQYYWLGSSSEGCMEGEISYCLRSVWNGTVNITHLFGSGGGQMDKSIGLRPVVALASDVQVSSLGEITK